jgi:hypothetical protein
MVVFIDGKPAKSEYRKFKIRSKDTPDDFAMMRETLARRLARLSDPNLQTTSESTNTNEVGTSDSNLKPTASHLASWPRPDLIVIDGGKGQLSAALEAQAEFQNLTRNSDFVIPFIGLAKRIEEIFLPLNPEPIILSHDEPALQMLQRTPTRTPTPQSCRPSGASCQWSPTYMPPVGTIPTHNCCAGLGCSGSNLDFMCVPLGGLGCGTQNQSCGPSGGGRPCCSGKTCRFSTTGRYECL